MSGFQLMYRVMERTQCNWPACIEFVSLTLVAGIPSVTTPQPMLC